MALAKKPLVKKPFFVSLEAFNKLLKSDFRCPKQEHSKLISHFLHHGGDLNFMNFALLGDLILSQMSKI